MTIWHPNTEIPPEDSDCMVVIKSKLNGKYKEGELRMCEAFFNRKLMAFMVGRDLLPFTTSQIERWCYYDDLVKEAMR